MTTENADFGDQGFPILQGVLPIKTGQVPAEINFPSGV